MDIARIRESDKCVQSVREHCENVARLAVAVGQMFGLKAVCELIGLLHDMGKATVRFAEYILYQVAHPKNPLPKNHAPHTPTGAIFAWERWYGGDTYRKITAQIVAMVVRGHHGGMLDCVDDAGDSPLNDTLGRDKADLCYDESVEHYFADVRKPFELDRLFDEAVREIEALIERFPAKERRFHCAMLARFLLGILVDADRHDAACFERGEDPFSATPVRADWRDLLFRLNEHLKGFAREKPIDTLRWQVSEDCLACAGRPGKIFTLTVPTGGAKTFASLRYALARADQKHLDRIFYVIPFNTIIDQNARDIRRALGGYEGILEHHGNLAFDDEDEYRAHTRSTDRWDAPIILTSMVQFLDSLFRAENTDARRMPSLGRSVIIFDEIQALPPKCTHLFENAIRYLTEACDCTVVLCTATQPALRLEAAEMMPDPSGLAAALRRVRFVDETHMPRAMERAASDLLGLRDKHASVLCIVNKKEQAAYLYGEAVRSLPDDVLCVHLSTDMCAKHRMNALDTVKAALSDNRPVFCVSTSLIEAGINISFPCVVRFYTGLPSILQSAGRCNRHDELSEKGTVYIWAIADEKLGCNLKYIQTGKECTASALELAGMGVPLDSPSVIADYFERERYAYRQVLSYPLKNGSTIESLLDANPSGMQAAKRKHDSRITRLALRQAFMTAGKEFHVINNDSQTIVAPYEEAEELLERLLSRHTIGEERSLLRKLQPYTINVYEYVRKALLEEGALYPVGETGVVALRAEYYDPNTGLMRTAGEMPFYDI